MRTPVAVPLMRAPRKRGNREKADPCTMVIFGGAGDLTKRKLIPAIYYLAEQKLLPDNFALLGVARDQNTDEGYRAMMREAMTHSDEIHKVHDEVWQWLCERTFYAGGDFSKDEAYVNIEKRLKVAAWLFADVGNHRIRINADTRRDAVARFVRLNMPALRLWPVVANNRGTVNKVLQSPDRERVKYWNAYLVRPVAAEIFL